MLVTCSCHSRNLVHTAACNQLEAWEDSPAEDNPSIPSGCSIPYHHSPDIHTNTTRAIKTLAIYPNINNCIQYKMHLSLSLNFNGLLPGEPGLVFIEAKDSGSGGDNWTGTISHTKLQSNHHHQQTNIQFFYRPDALPVAQQTVSNITSHGLAYPKLTRGSSNFCLWPLIAPGYLGEVCHASHQPSDASTPIQDASLLIYLHKKPYTTPHANVEWIRSHRMDNTTTDIGHEYISATITSSIMQLSQQSV